MNRLSQQRGASLLEVLSVIVLLSIVGAVAYSFLMNTFLFEDRVTERQSLVQEVNLLSADLRRLHESGAPIYYDGSMLYEGRGADRPILDDEIHLDSFYANENELSPGTSITLTEDTYRFEGSITAGGYTHELRTASRRTGAFVYDPSAGNDDVEPEPPPEEEEPQEDLSGITFPPRNEWADFNAFSCESNGDTVFENSTFANWGAPCRENYVYNGSMFFPNASSMNHNGPYILLDVEESVFINSSFNLYDDSRIRADKHVWTNGSLTLHTNSEITAGDGTRVNGRLRLQSNTFLDTIRLEVTDSLQLERNARIGAAQYTTVNGPLTMQSSTRLETGELTVADAAALQSDSVLTIAGPSIIDGPLTMDRDSIFTTGSLRLGGAGTFRSNAVLASENEVTIGGEATFQENVNVQAGSLFIDGNMRVTGTPVIQIDGDAGINGGLTTENTMYMTVGGDLVLENGAALRQNPVITIGGTLTSRDDFSYQSGSTIIVEGNADIRGNIGSNSPYDQGSMCVQGSLSLEGRAFPGVDITTSGSDCSNLSPGELRVLGPIL